MTGVEKADKLNRLLADLQSALDSGAIAVVEGPNDERALRTLGMKGRVEQLSRTPYSELAEKLAGKCQEVIILTDFDAYGKKAAKGLRDSFLNECVRPDLSFRTRFKKLLGYTEFEDVPSLFENEINR
ncbi:MAG: toprim domain-containing protein [Candidatus Diapherotrites archaeon]|nr:toprim domain-containing protein [Candidatus Diapherotrites archaeon]